MDRSWLKYCATEEQLKTFNDEGYLIVEDALTPEMVDKLNVVVERIDAEERAKQGLCPHPLVKKFRTVVADDLFLELLDTPKMFPLLWDILGWNIQFYISHLIIYPPDPPDAPRFRTGVGWHQDGGRPVPEMERPHPRLSLKVSYWLSDVSQPDRGALRIFPVATNSTRAPLRAPRMVTRTVQSKYE